VDWSDGAKSDEAVALMLRWPRPSVETVLELLDAKFTEPRVREFAVSVLSARFGSGAPNPEKTARSSFQLVTILLQLVQALKHETDAFNALWLFLYFRGMQEPRCGIKLLWFLRSEIHRPELSLRFGLYVDTLVRGLASSPAGSGGKLVLELAAQACLLDSFTEVALLVKEANSSGGKVAREKVMVAELSLLATKFPQPHATLPLFPERELCGLDVSKCKVMQSKKMPLWLHFDQSDGQRGKPAPTTTVIYKVGDDLRQDQLTLQMITLMDVLWKARELDMRMSPYGVVATGDGVGLLEGTFKFSRLLPCPFW
jgi:Phosphoinositide 3-kinase family, accessory domain (PIK domain)/Phosphatidylinositol 3- and 4-kinase